MNRCAPLSRYVPSLFACPVTDRHLYFTCWRLLITRLYTENSNGPDTGADGEQQYEHFEGSVPRDKLSVSFSRSSGPGGQNVNKVNTKANVKFHVDSADWLSQRVKDRFKQLFQSRINKAGELMISSQKHRSQLMNLNDVFAKVEEMLREASEVPQGPSQLTVARVKQLKRKSEKRRLTDKKYHSSKKRDRSSTDF